jgi:hypothetical protein
MTKITLESTEPIIKKPRKKRGPYKKKTKTVAISAKKPKKTKQENKTIVGDFIVTNLNQHFSNIIDGAMSEKRRLVKSDKYKNKKLKYTLGSDGSLKVGKKSTSDKNTVIVHYN